MFDGLTGREDWDAKAFEKFIAENGLKEDDETKEWLLDLDYFRANLLVRRPERWQS